MHPSDNILELVQLSYYIAPSGRTEVWANTIPEGTEYIELITAGGVFHEENGVDTYYGPGTLFWHLPGEKTVHRYSQENPYECFVAIFKIASPQRRIANRVGFWNPLQEARDFIEESLRVYHSDVFNREVLARNIHARLLYATCNSARYSLAKDTPQTIAKALKIIERDFASELDIGSLAEKLCVSSPYLHALFKKHLGETPHQLITSRRLQEARRLLASGNLNLKTLAFECGFRNIEHFCRLFKSKTGMTPTEYRRKNELPQRYD